MAANQFTALVMDLGGVFFDFDSHADSSIGALQLKAVLGSPTWHTYECGQLPQQECYDIISKQFGFAAGELERAINLAATTLRFNRDLVEFVKQMKKDANGKLRVFAMSNVSQPDFEVLRDEMEKWDIFDRVFTSGRVGTRKPAFEFYRTVLKDIEAEPQSTIFVDDTLENVIVAESLGLHGIVFDNTANVSRILKNKLGNPLERAERYLRMHAGNMFSTTNTGIRIRENFSQLLILHATGDR